MLHGSRFESQGSKVLIDRRRRKAAAFEHFEHPEGSKMQKQEGGSATKIAGFDSIIPQTLLYPPTPQLREQHQSPKI